MQIHELNSFVGTPSSTDYLAIDDGDMTTKVPATDLGITTEMTQAEAESGTETAPRVISPAVLKSFVDGKLDAFAVPVSISKTYTSQSYVTEANELSSFYRLGKLFFGKINIRITTSPGTTFREIAKLDTTLDGAVNVVLASQNNESNLLLTISSAGSVQIYSTASATGFYRGFVLGVIA